MYFGYTEQLRKRLLLFPLLLLSMIVHGKDDATISTPLITGSALVASPNTTGWIEVFNYNNPAVIETEHSSTAVVILQIMEKENFLIPSDFTADIQVKIHYESVTGFSSNVVQTFTVDYKKAAGQKFKAKDYFSIKGIKKLKLEILNVNFNGATWAVGDVLSLKGELRAKRDYVFDANTPVNPGIPNPNASAGQPFDEIRIGWGGESTPQGCTHYDVEWAWVDKAALESYYKENSTTILDPVKVFGNNSTRVTLSAPRNEYNIPVFYDGEGYVIYRVRPVQLKENGTIVNGVWTTPDDADMVLTDNSVFAFYGHEWGLNWQASTTYAEGDLRKTVIQYYDGSLRARQTVTKDNETGKTVVAETFYDYQGRPAIQVLPAPTLNKVIAYTKNFNQFIDGQSYPKDLYDLLQPMEELCIKGAPKLSTAKGASKYYSPDNPERGAGYRLANFIPDANGYPFTETRYTPDNTGRIAVQGGVGDMHQLEGSHATKYYYGSADQKELDALFGTEVGNASHYFKNMVRDANGQYSVSYVDMHGRTIATALAGTPPASLQGLASSNPANFPTIKQNLLDAQTNVVKGRSIESAKTLLVPIQSDYTFSYKLNPEELKILNCNNQQVCYDCRYDLEITIRNQCGDYVRTYTHKNISVAACNSTDGFNWTQTYNLPEGEYDITKRLTINEEAFLAHKETFLANNTCLTLEQIQETTYLAMAGQNPACKPTCATCTTAVGTYSGFKTKFLQSLGITGSVSAELEATITQAYNEALKECQELCNPSFSKLKAIRQAMLDDLTPVTGQYTRVPPSILSTADFSIFGSLRSNGVLHRKVYRNFAPTVEEYIQNFKPEWSEALLQYHPEYCKLSKAETFLKPSFDFDNNMENAEGFSAAQSAGYISASIVNLDPFFSGAGAAYKNQMVDAVNVNYHGQGFSMWKIAYVAVFCRNSPDQNCADNVASTPPYQVNNCTEDWNNFWKIFRTLYQTEKDRLVNKYFEIVCTDPTNNDLKSRGFRLHFDGYEQFFQTQPAMGNYGNLLSQLNNNPSDPGPVNTAMQEMYEENCRSNIQNWKEVLLSCPQIKEIQDENLRNQVITEITEGFFQVCKTAAGTSHPFGASNDPNGGSFEEVMQQVFANYSLTINEFCNPYMIQWPKPYERQPAMNAEDVTTPKNDCVCEKIVEIKEAKQQAQFAGTLSEFIQYQYGTFISQGKLDTLIMGCADVYPCNFLKESISLPPILQCNTPLEVCISCVEYNQYRAEFETKYGKNPPYENPDEEWKVRMNNLFAQFVNYKTGFSKGWIEYYEFEKACRLYDENNPFTCAQLTEFLQQFLATYTEPNFGNSCKQAFTQAFNNRFTTFYTFMDIQALYVKYCGSAPEVCIPQVTCTVFNQVITAFYQQHGSSISLNADCKELFTSYFNQYFGTFSYTWDELTAIYSNLCNRELDVCNPVNCTRLQEALDEYYATYGTNTWVYEDCAERFRDFINVYFSTDLTIEEINQRYEQCGILLKVCMPPYPCEQLNKLKETYSRGEYHCTLEIEDEILRCQECFAAFVNSELNTSYSYIQIALMYKMVCHEELGLCEGTMNCEELSQLASDFANAHSSGFNGYNCKDLFVEFINRALETNYTYDQIMALYMYYCGRIPSVCDPIEITSCEQVTIVLENFYIQYPNPALQLGSNCQQVFINFFNNSFGRNYNFAEIMAFYQSLCGTVPDICSADNCATLQNIYNDYVSSYSNYNLPQSLCRDHFAWYFSQQYSGNYNWGQVKQMYQNCGITLNICPLVSNPVNTACAQLEAIINIYNSIEPPAAPGENCKVKFARWFNRYYGLLWSYDEISNYFNTQCLTPLEAFLICSDEYGRPAILNNDLWLVVEADLVRPPRLCGLNYPAFPPVVKTEDDPCKDFMTFSFYAAIEQYENYKQTLRDEFETKYLQKCLAAKSREEFTVEHKVAEYHYTLYYYDQAGNLVKTVPPQGVKANFTTDWLTDIATKRGLNQTQVAPHTMATHYRYNALNQVRKQLTPDGGESEFWYDRLGRLVVSQNAKQKALNRFSYTLYDILGRISEVGEKQKAAGNTMEQATSRDAALLYTWLTADGNPRREITRTVYDLSYAALCNAGSGSPGNLLCQENLRNRVSYTMVIPSETGAPPATTIGGWSSATFYTYDIHGNVGELLQDYRTGAMAANNQYKRIQYNYDLVSGKVNKVAYQPGKADAFYHRYEYDGENRITYVNTSSDELMWDRDAAYKYYKHGPLGRTVLGDNQVQGIDYAYTLHGWIKGVNGTDPDNNDDIGEDAADFASVNSNVAKDVFAFSLNYYDGDYKAISAMTPFTDVINPLGTDARQLYNGNIAAMAVNIPKLGSPKVYNYGYDQLNRLINMDAYEGITNSNDFEPVQLNAYKERITYDANGNILSYLRNGATSQPNMDNLDYHYYYQSTDIVNNQRVWKTYKPGTSNNTAPTDLYAYSNRLAHVNDDIAYDGNYTEDIDDQADNNYEYDEIGNLVKDVKEGITNIAWNVYGKIASITKIKNSITTNISYTYDAAGNRISKNVNGAETWYVRDASGNVMAVYNKTNSSANIKQTEVHLYGSSRLGVYNRDVNVDVIAGNEVYVEGASDDKGFKFNLERGNKFFELSNHLGNVLVTVSDRVIQTQYAGSTTVYYEADVASASDYAPFGMQMVGRTFSAGLYRYGFNGKENDSDVKGEGNQQDYGMRIYDPRISRFLSIDPLARKLAWETNYGYCGGNPILYIDQEGELRVKCTQVFDERTGKTTFKIDLVDQKLQKEVHKDGVWVGPHWESWDWFDYIEIEYITINKDGSKSTTTGTTQVGLRENTAWDWGEDYANGWIDDGVFEDWGGINWTSKNPGGYETKKGNVEIESIDGILKQIAKINKLAKIKTADINKMKNTLEKLMKILELDPPKEEQKLERNKAYAELSKELDEIIASNTPPPPPNQGVVPNSPPSNNKKSTAEKTKSNNGLESSQVAPVKVYPDGSSAKKEKGLPFGRKPSYNKDKPDTLYYQKP